MTLLVLISLILFAPVSAIIYHLDHTISFCHSPSVLDRHRAEHMVISNCLITNGTFNYTQIIILWSATCFRFYFPFNLALSLCYPLSFSYHFHPTSSVDFKTCVQFPDWHGYIWVTYCPHNPMSLNMTGLLQMSASCPCCRENRYLLCMGSMARTHCTPFFSNTYLLKEYGLLST